MFPAPEAWPETPRLRMELGEIQSALRSLPPTAPTCRIQPAILAASFAEIRRRHEVLRATFRAVDGKPRMEFAPPRVDPVPMVDLAGPPPSRRLDEAESPADTEGGGPSI